MGRVRTFDTSRDRANGEKVPVHGAGLFISSRPPLEATISFDGLIETRPIAEGDVILQPFESFSLYHPYQESGRFTIEVLGEQEYIQRALPRDVRCADVNVVALLDGPAFRVHYLRNFNTHDLYGPTTLVNPETRALHRITKLLISPRGLAAGEYFLVSWGTLRDYDPGALAPVGWSKCYLDTRISSRPYEIETLEVYKPAAVEPDTHFAGYISFEPDVPTPLVVPMRATIKNGDAFVLYVSLVGAPAADKEVRFLVSLEEEVY